ncbi:YhgE/Pip domain-containing protein [Nocardia sp. NPDC019255]|uniref:YhgE/Pip domain-containing protein n=1 Tax=Nocardia sp. NPDC019255 TaxID=3154591 RepID=UPI0033CCFA3D
MRAAGHLCPIGAGRAVMAGNSITARLLDGLRVIRADPPSRHGLLPALLVLGLVVPTLVSAVYMWVMWDPEVYLKHVPVAVASDDAGGIDNGKPENFGAQILDGLASDKDVEFHRVSSAEAVAGLRESRYAFSVVIPRDFTRDILTVTDPKPTPARINVWYNDFNGTLGSAVANSVVAQAQRQITASIGREFATQVLIGINSLGSGLGDAAHGATQLADGTTQLADGSAQLATGLDQALIGSTQLANGTGQLSNGATQLATGATQLVGGTDQLGSGAAQIRDGVDQIAAPILAALTPFDQLATQLDSLLDKLALSSDPAMIAAVTQLRSLLNQVRQTNPDSITSQITQLRDGTRELARQLTDSNADYRAGVLALAQGAGQLRDGTQALDQGTKQLTTGLGQLATGGHQLEDGAEQLDNGMHQLDAGLTDGSAAAPHIADPHASAGMFSEPFSMNISNQEPAQRVVNGDRSHKVLAGGAGPVIVVLGTFLTVIVAWMLLKPLRASTQPGSLRRRALRSVVDKTLIGSVWGIVAAGATAAYGKSVGWEPHNWATMIAVVVLVGITAAVTTHMFIVVFGRVAGSIAAFSFYMFGLFAFGGVFPLGTTPSAFKPFADISPLTFARRAIIRCDLGLYDQMFWISVMMLTALTALTLTIAVSAQYLRLRATTGGRPNPLGAADEFTVPA